MKYKHTQISYMMIIVTLIIAINFVRIHITASAEPRSIDSGSNLLVVAIMALIVFILASFVSLQVSIDQKYL